MVFQSNALQVFVRVGETSYPVVLSGGPRSTVDCLKADLQSKLGNLQSLSHRLVFGGKVLAKGIAFQEYAIQSGSTIDFLVDLKGGALLGKDMKGRGKTADVDDRYARQKQEEERSKKFKDTKTDLEAQLEREKANMKLNRMKIQNQWRKMMRLAKTETLKKEIEILAQNHERDVDRKDAIIQMLDRDLEESEDQFQMALRRHLENVDRLIDLHDSRLLALEQEFERQLGLVENEFGEEKTLITKTHAKFVQELKDIAQAVHKEEVDAETDAHQEHEQSREEIKNKNLEDINMLRIQLDSQIEELEQKFENAHLNYLQTTDQRTSDFKYFTKKDQELSKDIEIKIRIIERLQSSLVHWRTKSNQNRKESQARNKLMSEEKAKVSAHFQHLKRRMEKMRGVQHERQIELSQNAGQAHAKIKQTKELAERILSAAELARKMETERELVAPYYESAVGESEEPEAQMQPIKKDKEVKILPYQSYATTSEGEVVRKWDQLGNFYKKFNKVLLDKLAIERERQRLREENEHLQGILKQYVDGVSVNPEVMNQEGNPLLVINGRVNLNQPMPVRLDQGAMSVLDGNHLVQTNRVNTSALG